MVSTKVARNCWLAASSTANGGFGMPKTSCSVTDLWIHSSYLKRPQLTPFCWGLFLWSFTLWKFTRSRISRTSEANWKQKSPSASFLGRNLRHFYFDLPKKIWNPPRKFCRKLGSCPHCKFFLNSYFDCKWNLFLTNYNHFLSRPGCLTRPAIGFRGAASHISGLCWYLSCLLRAKNYPRGFVGYDRWLHLSTSVAGP